LCGSAARKRYLYIQNKVVTRRVSAHLVATLLPINLRDYPLYSVPAGCLDASIDVKIVAQLYLGSKAAWDKECPEGLQFTEMPELEEMLELLHAGA
jgi:hypothetical protein